MSDLIKQLLDLDGWTETVAVGCSDGIVCPHCGQKYPPVSFTALNLIFRACSKCGRSFTVKEVDTPLGRAFHTERIG